MKTLEIEWKHLDVEGKTCARCSDTGEALQEVIGKLTEECNASGWEIKFKETKLTSKNISLSLATSIMLINRFSTLWFMTAVGFFTWFFVLQRNND